MDGQGLRKLIDEMVVEALKDPTDEIVRSQTARKNAITTALREMNSTLPLRDSKTLEEEIGKFLPQIVPQRDPQKVLQRVEAARVFEIAEALYRYADTYQRAATSIASTGIFISLCQNDRIRSVAVEVGWSTLQAASNPDYANDHSIRLNTITAQVSYRLPLPPDRDIIDIGSSAGMYVFSSRGFDTFRGLILEPVFVDLHAPTKLVNAGGLKQLGALFTLRLSGVMFPGGFDRAQFASVSSKPAEIPGSEVNLSATVFFNLTPLLWRRPTTSIPRYGAIVP